MNASRVAASTLDELIIRPATPGDIDSILDLVRISLGDDGPPRSRAYWEWKHRENPFGESPALLAVSRDELVGLRVFLRWRYRQEGRILPAVRAVDTATHPGWRGRGIFTRLTRELLEQSTKEGTAFVFNTPNARSRPGYLKMGWQDVGRISVWIRPIAPGRLAARAFGRNGASPGGPPPPPGGPVGELIRERWFKEVLRALASDPSARLTTDRSVEYLRWRYVNPPGLSYRAFWRFHSRTGGAAILRMKSGKWGTELRICELLATRGSQDATTGLLDAIARQCDADFVSAVAPWGSSRQRALHRAGFLPAPRSGPRMTVRSITSHPTDVDPYRPGSWDLSMGDLELF